MKFKFANGHSLNLWESEYDKIVISVGKITCTRPDGKVAVIEVPEQWMEGFTPKYELQQHRNDPSAAAMKGVGYCDKGISEMDGDTPSSGPVSPRNGTSDPVGEIGIDPARLPAVIEGRRLKADSHCSVSSVADAIPAATANIHKIPVGKGFDSTNVSDDTAETIANIDRMLGKRSDKATMNVETSNSEMDLIMKADILNAEWKVLTNQMETCGRTRLNIGPPDQKEISRTVTTNQMETCGGTRPSIGLPNQKEIPRTMRNGLSDKKLQQAREIYKEMMGEEFDPTDIPEDPLQEQKVNSTHGKDTRNKKSKVKRRSR